MINPIKFIKQKLLGQNPIKHDSVPTKITIVQKLDFSKAVVNPDGTSSLSLTDTNPSLGIRKLKDRHFNEPEFVEWLIKKGHIEKLWSELFPKADCELRYNIELKEPFTVKGNKPGDIDIIAFQNVDTAVGIECKIIKYDFDKQIKNPKHKAGAFNKLNGIDKAWVQLEGYKKLGFHKTFLLLIVLDDQSGNNAAGQLSRKMDSKLIGQFTNLRSDNDTGVIVFKVSQISKFELDVQNIVSFEVIRQATPILQSSKLTEMIIENSHLFKLE